MQPLAPRDLLVLAVLADGPQHGYGIIKAVEERSSHDVLLDPANLYRVLRRMQVDGWIDAGSIELTRDDLDETAELIRTTGAGSGPSLPR